MTNIFVLKVESDQGTLLVSRNSTQEISPKSKYEIIRNINSDMIKQTDSKMKCTIETKDTPDISMLQCNNKFKIHSILEFKQYNSEKPNMEYIPNTLQKHDDCITFRPILRMALTNFSLKTDSSKLPTWKLEFEEV